MRVTRPDIERRLRRLERLEDAAIDGLGGDVAERFGPRFYRDPIGFQEAVLGRDLYVKQREICEAVLNNPVTVIPAGKACGKSYLLAGLALWWVYTREGGRCIITSASFRTVVAIVFAELRRAVYRAAEELPYQFLSGGYGSPQLLILDRANRHEVIGFVGVDEESFSGHHAGELMVIADEASGISDEAFNGIDGLGARRLIVSGNPIRYSCKFRELADMAAAGSPDVQAVPISSLDSPHAHLEHSPVGLASASFLRFMKSKHGEFSPFYKSNILGQFPGQESVRFLPQAWIDACADPAILEDELWQDFPAGRRRMSIDVGGGVGADRSVVVVRDNRQLLHVFASEWTGVLDDARERLEPVVAGLAARYGVLGSDITYDASGIGRSLGNYLRAEGIVGAVGYFGAGRGSRFYSNRRTSCAFALRDRLDPNRSDHVGFYCGGIPEWPALREELMTLHEGEMDTYEGEVRQSLELKEAWKNRLKRSPDVADALIQSFTYVGE